MSSAHYRDIAQFWQSASLGWKRPQVQVLLFRPPWLARLSDITDDGNTSSQFRRGRPLLVNKAHPKPAFGEVSGIQINLAVIGPCRLTGGRRINNARNLKFADCAESCRNPTRYPRYGRKRRPRQVRNWKRGQHVTAGVQVSTPNKMVGKARRIP